MDLEIYCEKIGLTVEKLKSDSRLREIVTPRQVYWHYLKSKGFGESEIGRMFNKNHATVIYGIDRVRELIDSGDLYVKNYLNVINK